ncbi:MAG: c-type cytochrome [Bryobacterales bacterium]|nr:c-type cytochrome [Bryobacterales bacterium]
MMLVSCATEKPVEGPAKPIGAPVVLKAWLGLPPVPVPADNPLTAETVALGRRLYYDTKLSRDNTVSCASCHSPVLGFADGKRVSSGVGGKTGNRNAPTVWNAAYASVQFWDGRAPTLEEQAAGPIENPVEMDLPHDQLLGRLNGDPAYGRLFTQAFGPGRITMDKVKKAIAGFERTVVSGNSAFDRYQYGRDKTAMSEAAIRGLAIFQDAKRGNCAVCHTIEEKYALFSDGKFHNLGTGMDEQGELRDKGRYDVTKVEADLGAFRTSTLRNIAKTAPYMHDGSQKTLREVVDFYVGGGNANPHLDKEIKELKLSQRDRADLVAFLEALTCEMPPDAGPPGGL